MSICSQDYIHEMRKLFHLKIFNEKQPIVGHEMVATTCGCGEIFFRQGIEKLELPQRKQIQITVVIGAGSGAENARR